VKNSTCVITGATSGIGRAAALALGDAGANLVLVGRNEGQGQQTVRHILRRRPSVNVEFIRTDLSSQSEVKTLAGRIAEKYQALDVLINNAGARFDDYRQSVDGLEVTFATNHLGHFTLTCLLLPRLLAAPSGRVVTVGSGSHSMDGDQVRWLLDRNSYDRKVAYATSKLANIVFAYELARRLKATKVSSNAVNPGGVFTNLSRNNGLKSWLRHVMAHALQRNLISPRKGAETLVYLAAAQEVQGVSGKYFFQRREVASSRLSQNQELWRQLWDLSLELTGLNESVGSAWPWIRP
jgi:NAD(P)-dependent dehydrogenase (short-subunit alcohol dehydrogenase family)